MIEKEHWNTNDSKVWSIDTRPPVSVTMKEITSMGKDEDERKSGAEGRERERK